MRQRLGQENVNRFGWMTNQPPLQQQLAIEQGREERNAERRHPRRNETCDGEV